MKKNLYVTEPHCCTPENIVNQLYFKKKIIPLRPATILQLKTSKQLSFKACVPWSMPASPVSSCKSLPTLSPQFSSDVSSESSYIQRGLPWPPKTRSCPTEHLSEHSVLHSTPRSFTSLHPPPQAGTLTPSGRTVCSVFSPVSTVPVA